MGEKVKHFVHKQLLFNLVTEGMTQSFEIPCITLVDQCCISTCILYNRIGFLSLSHALDPICCSEWISFPNPRKTVCSPHLFLQWDSKLFINSTCRDITQWMIKSFPSVSVHKYLRVWLPSFAHSVPRRTGCWGTATWVCLACRWGPTPCSPLRASP